MASGTLLQKQLREHLKSPSLRDRIFPEKPLAEYSGKELTIALLGMLVAGTVLVALLAAPNLGLLFKHFGATSKKDRYRIYRKLTYLEKTGYVHWSGSRLTPTPKGLAMLQKSMLRARTKLHTAPWDGMWHLVIFDLPTEHAPARQDLRRFLLSLGYVHYQQSVFVHKFDFHKELEEFCSLYGIRRHVNFVVATHFDNQRAVEAEFANRLKDTKLLS